MFRTGGDVSAIERPVVDVQFPVELACGPSLGKVLWERSAPCGMSGCADVQAVGWNNGTSLFSRASYSPCDDGSPTVCR